MAYIIENANILKEKKLHKTSLLVEKGRISMMRSDFNRYKHMRMNFDSYIMTPPPVLLIKEFPSHLSFQEMKHFYINEIILKGCTVFLTAARVHLEHELTSEIKRLKMKLINSPVDYVIGVRIPVRLLSPSFLRKCRREKVPAIFVDVCDEQELRRLPWGWLREAMFPYNSPLIPIFHGEIEKSLKQLKALWKETLEKERIPAIYEEIKENEPIPLPILSKIGIIPLKANIQQGTELSYNLYHTDAQIRYIEEDGLFHYHRNKLIITVHKGEVITAANKVYFRPGQGEHVEIKTPSFYKLEE